MKRAFFGLLIFFCSLNVLAEIGSGVKLQFASGDQVVIQLEEKPVFTFDTNEIVVTTSERILRCDSDDLLKFTYINIPPSSVGNTEIDYVNIKIIDGGIFASNLKPNSEFRVFTQDGKFVCSATTNEQGIVNTHFPMQRGVVYIIKSSTKNIKLYAK